LSTLTVVQELIAKSAEVPLEKLEPTRPLQELDVDSLTVLEVMFDLEEKFKIKMPEERVPIRSVQDIADLVDRLVAEQSRGTK
jgi:acyl carrier protein